MGARVWGKASNFWRNRIMHQTWLSILKNYTQEENQTKVYLAESVPAFGSENQGTRST